MSSKHVFDVVKASRGEPAWTEVQDDDTPADADGRCTCGHAREDHQVGGDHLCGECDCWGFTPPRFAL